MEVITSSNKATIEIKFEKQTNNKLFMVSTNKGVEGGVLNVIRWMNNINLNKIRIEAVLTVT